MLILLAPFDSAAESGDLDLMDGLELAGRPAARKRHRSWP